MLYHELYVHLNQIINSVFVTISVFMESMIQNIQIYSLSTLPDAMQSILNRAVSSNFKSRSNASAQNSSFVPKLQKKFILVKYILDEISQQLYLFLNRS